MSKEILEKKSKRCFGIIGGPDTAGVAEDLLKRLEYLAGKREENVPAEALLGQRPFQGREEKRTQNAVQNERKIYVFDMILALAERGAEQILLPCFPSHVFLDEIEAEAPLRTVNMMEALRDHLVRQHVRGGGLGILASGAVREARLFERYFPEKDWQLFYPDEALQPGDAADKLAEICFSLIRQGAGVIVPGSAETMMFSEELRKRGLPVFDVNEAYAEYALSLPAGRKRRPFKIGIVGGVGPAATVDFVDKIVRNTPAGRDQEHVKLVVEQNPQIPDRTANLLSGGADPTIALYSTCKKLEADGASIIAIPCNTAHAFVERIQPHLSIPIVNMLRETAEHIGRTSAGRRVVGLLATSGTIRSRVYHDVIIPAGFELRVPDEENQHRVMNAIYGPRGVKAGHTEGECVEDLRQALASLVAAGAEIILLGCTELPLLIQENEALAVAGKTVTVLDPTAILARRCVALGVAQEA